MPTLNDITAGHSTRISRIAQLRDARLRAAATARDRALREVTAAAPFYDAFDARVADARSKQLTTDAKAEAARAAALQDESEALAAALATAHRVRREADVSAFEKRRVAEEEAEREFLLAIGSSAPPATALAAQQRRAQQLDQAKKEFDAALTASQDDFRKARDKALLAESKGSRDADRSFAAAARVSDTSTRAARAAAEQALAKALAALPQAAAAFAEWRSATSAIVADYKRAENEEFERFHREVQALKR